MNISYELNNNNLSITVTTDAGESSLVKIYQDDLDDVDSEVEKLVEKYNLKDRANDQP